MNKSGDENRSVRNTKKRLKDGFLQLLQEKPVNEISVKELTALADMNRGTFYTHYSDVYDLLGRIEDDYFAEFERSLAATATTREELYAALLNMFRYLGENSQFFIAITGRNGDKSFGERLGRLMEDKCEGFWLRCFPGMPRNTFEIYKVFLLSGLHGLIRYWLFCGEHATAEDMAAAASNMIYRCLTPDINVN